MKKFLALVMAMMMVLAMGTAFAADYEDQQTVTITKTYKLKNTGMKSPAETFSFSTLTCTSVTDAAAGVTTTNAPVPTIGSVTYADGEATSEGTKKTITINLPTYTSVGVYTYTFTETNNNYAGVTYHDDTITLVVTVIQDTAGKIRVAAVHTEGENEEKSDEFENMYSAGALTVTKKVAGLLGDQTKKFTVRITLSQSTETVGGKSWMTITRPDGSTITSKAPYSGSSDTYVVELAHNESVTISNIPYGVTYTVVEDTYEGYEADYDFSDEGETKAINSAAESAVITNTKDGDVDTGLFMDNAPYMMIMAMVVLAGVAMMMKRRAYND